ncbi:MAG: hypothetical protein ACTH6D_08020 [Vibrio litoralis]
MDNIAEYGISIEFENKRRLFRELQDFEKKFNKINTDAHRKEMKRQKELLDLHKKNNDKKLRDDKKTNAQEERETKKTLATEKRAQEKAQREENRRLEKQRVQQKRFNDWKLRQFRSASYARLSLEQKMELKRVLSAKKSEAEIREEYAKTTSHYARELKQRAAYERKQQAKNRSKNDGGKGSKDGKSGTMLPIALNPALMAGAGIALGGMAVKQGLTSGQQRYERLQQGSDQTGISVDDLQRRAYISQGVSEEFNLDKQIDMLSDTQEKIGEALSEGSFNKEGEFTGGAGAGDLINSLVRSGALEANKKSVEAYFADADKNMGVMIDRVFADVNSNIQDQGKARFILESLASDLGKLNNAMNQNQAKVDQLTKSYDQNNIGLTDDDIKRLQKADSMFATISATLSNFSLKFYNGFTKAFGDETQSKLSEFFSTLMKLAEPLGRLTARILLPLLERLDWVIKGLNLFLDALDWVDAKLKPFKDTIKNFFADMLDDIQSFFADMLPSWMQSDDDKKQSSDKQSSDVNNTTNNIDNSNIDKSVINNKSESIENSYNPYAQSAVGSYKMNLGTLPTPSNDTKPQPQVQTHGYSTSTLPTYNPYAQVPTVPTVPTIPTMAKVVPPQPTAASTQQMNNVNNNNVTVNPVVNTTVELDGETIANSISQTSSFQNGVAQTIYPIMQGGQ